VRTLAIKEKDFIQITYTGKVTENNAVFDTTDENIAKAAKLYDSRKNYGSVIICVGQRQVLEGLDTALIGKSENEAFDVIVPAEKAFGKKSADNIQFIPANKFLEQKIQPQVGLSVHVNKQQGIIKTVSGGRCLVDFNHPIAGKDVTYKVQLGKLITDPKAKLDALLGLTFKGMETTVVTGEATVTAPHELPKPFQEIIEKQIKLTIPEISTVAFATKEEKKGD
jgi:peptidylprolyl isomerase